MGLDLVVMALVDVSTGVASAHRQGEVHLLQAVLCTFVLRSAHVAF